MAKDSRDLFNVNFMTIPAYTNATTTNPALTISKVAINDNDLLSAWYWLIASKDPSISYTDGTVYPSQSLRSGESYVSGLMATYNNLNNSQSTTRIDQQVNIAQEDARQSTQTPYQVGNGNSLNVTWSGMLIPTSTGTYTFTFGGFGRWSVTVNGRNISKFDWWSYGGWTTDSISLTAGQPVPISITYQNQWSINKAQLYWTTPDDQYNNAPIPSSNLQTTVDALGAPVPSPGAPLASGTSTTPAGRSFLFARQGYREATADEVNLAKSAGQPGGAINRFTPSLQVGPGERPSTVNTWGFDTGGSGYFVVPITVTNSPSN